MTPLPLSPMAVEAGFRVSRARCHCRRLRHDTRLVVVTGGPGAGKTAILSLARQRFCEHVTVLPEAATMLFSGGFPRYDDDDARRSVQRAIFHVQRELERTVLFAAPAVALCDRGTLDGCAYWPGDSQELLAACGTTREEELARYAAVIHLRVPPAPHFNHENPERIEDPWTAARLDERILEAWRGHPNVVVIDSAEEFLAKAARALEVIAAEVPSCCMPRVEMA